MIKVIIVDDQPRELAGMEKMMDWTNLGFQLEASFSSGEDALRFIAQNPVDIVITDIMMPQRDGISLISDIKGIKPAVKVVCISCFDDFKFASMAINQGARGYVLKPILVHEMQQILLKIKEELLVEKAKDSGPPTPLILGYKAFQGLLGAAEEEPLTGKYIICAFLADEPVLALVLAPDFSYPWIKEDDLIYIALPLLEEESSLSQIDDDLRRQLGLSKITPIGYSEKTRAAHFYQKKKEAYHHLHQAIGQDKAYSHSSVVFAPKDNFPFSTLHFAVVKFLEEQKIAWEPLLLHASLRQQKERVTLVILYLLWEIQKAHPKEEPLLPPGWADGLISCASKEDLIVKANQLLQAIEPKQMKDYQNTAVNQVKENVHQYLNNEIELGEITQNIYLTSGYMNTIFKQHTGVTIHQYIIGERLKKAKKLLLRENDKKISAIAEACGFSNASHFINAFKSKYHCTPSQYRRRGNKNA